MSRGFTARLAGFADAHGIPRVDLSQVTKAVLERALAEEMTGQLGYEKLSDDHEGEISGPGSSPPARGLPVIRPGTATPCRRPRPRGSSPVHCRHRAVRPGRETNARIRPLCRSIPRLVFGDHFEGQFEGQTAAREGLPEPVAACVSLCLAWSGSIWPDREPVSYSWHARGQGVRISLAPLRSCT
jgi:hypothetical protein